MGKIIFLIAAFLVIIIGLRLWNKAKRISIAKHEAQTRRVSETMVRCVSCGIFIPRSEARMEHDGYHCGAPHCARRS
ncbi:MAG: hypothetical protein LBS40_01105 [Burkholderiales bacterium]|jgi:hypothetical protein|nr:hypothetical protein [Burkholderiales bacterium]